MFQEINWIPALTFVIITALTPGPNNLSSASMGVLHGYRRSLNYVLGMVIGILVLSTLSGWAADLLLSVFPAYDSILRVIGAAYILWLAYNTLKAAYAVDDADCSPMGFKDGFIFQFLNPKVILFSLTLYASYLQSITHYFLPLFITAVVLAARAFLINSAWVLFGAAIRRLLSHALVRNAFNIIIASLLVYNAADLLGLPELLSNLNGSFFWK